LLAGCVKRYRPRAMATISHPPWSRLSGLVLFFVCSLGCEEPFSSPRDPSQNGPDGGGSMDGGAGDGDGDGDEDAALPPAPGDREVLHLAEGWRFHKGEADGAEAVDFDDASWEEIRVPHTWNAADGQDGPTTPYYRGAGWYRLHVSVPEEMQGKRLYLQFDAANIITDVWVNGQAAGTHRGGYARFRFDVSELLEASGDNVIAVRVDNSAGADAAHNLVAGSPTIDIAPLSADYTFYGGIYRDVYLVGADALSIDLMDYGSSGVYVRQTDVSAASAELNIRVKLSNASDQQRQAEVEVLVHDADGNVVLSLDASEQVDAASRAEAELSGSLEDPHLWNGRADPYLYSVRVNVREGDQVTDGLSVPLGLRFFALDPAQGFSLNGQYLDLYGVNKHQDQADTGWVISTEQTNADFDLIDELGCSAVRLAHYQHAQHTYDVTDARGLVTWAETPVINRINDTPAFAENAEQQLIELIRQNYNHPSIIFWSVGNEVLLRQGPNPDALIAHLSEVAAQEDPTRIVSYAANGGNEEHAANWHGEAHGFNEYHGWYHATVGAFAGWADGIHAAHPDEAVGVTEYGAGAAITQHTANPAAADTGGDHTPMAHTEEYQAYYHEGYWKVMKTRPFLWGKFIWNGFDFASDGRSEGSTPGLNDKGLTTHDRSVKKDAFYWYKANWSSEPFVHITSRRFTELAQQMTSVKVYSNVDSVELLLNGESLGAKTSSDHIFTWTDIDWSNGENVVEARAAGAESDQVSWQK
jgi:beta-galactosidase